MNAQRARAYTRLMRTLEDLGPAKLLAYEQARIRFAADSLLFCADLVHDRSARAAHADFDRLRDQLVRSGRWSRERAGRLADDVWNCGPGFAAPLVAPPELIPLG